MRIVITLVIILFSVTVFAQLDKQLTGFIGVNHQPV